VNAPGDRAFRAAFLNECLDRMQQFGEEIIK
jgi:hypothetical protein